MNNENDVRNQLEDLLNMVALDDELRDNLGLFYELDYARNGHDEGYLTSNETVTLRSRNGKKFLVTVQEV